MQLAESANQTLQSIKTKDTYAQRPGHNTYDKFHFIDSKHTNTTTDDLSSSQAHKANDET
jgi:hypothetical protein